LRRSEHPELLLATTRERGDASEAYRQTLTLGLRVPFGNNVRQHSLSRAAHADALEAEVRLERERERVHADIEAARTNMTLAAQGRDASAHRAQLAQDLRGFYAQAWQLGEVDLPTRLRIEQDAFEAGRAAARARFAHAAAISTLRQALGLLPE
jgi:cobalt-zinc-cadmium efflux system outer membrane protein